MTFKQMYTSLKSLYKKMMFPIEQGTQKWTQTDIDSLDVHFFYELMESEEEEIAEQDVYLSDIWS